MVTLILVVITGIISYLAWQNKKYYELGMHYPYREKRNGERWRALTGGFLHANPSHLIINMYMLYMFGQPVEQYFTAAKGFTGQLLFLALYLSTIIAANYFTGLKKGDDPYYRSVGASGATSGILFVYILFDPWQMFIFPPLPAIILAIGYLAYSTWASKNSKDNVDHMAHFYGALFGVVFALIFFPEIFDIFMSRIKNIPFLS